ncbi:hypothetical protein Rxyl_1914 [Rubrobacter xylanophilus DSM 9941]|uniref:Uncharacterized protein n=1 Tax=Rubrobacter xylanophilus (strain DSM 9941 / JCM 11954 / NBRC 16129 / PRD-1) TaxID=266117 RepID=Q1AUR7_RUBXD|nr:hypothetical protein [Rubrobacter xylanophilus]ABG04861.1 hypothetical protein Rxyl_1914 [Rubrobacter xylanophilus DSM 9941]
MGTGRRGPPDLISVCVSRGKSGTLVVTLRYAYEGRPPSRAKRTGMAKALLSEALDRLEKGKPADLGFAEDAVRRVRTDTMET